MLWEAPEKEAYQPEERQAKELNLERSDFVSERQPNAFRSGRAHQWLSGDLTGEIFQLRTINEKTHILWFSSVAWGEILTIYFLEDLNEGNIFLFYEGNTTYVNYSSATSPFFSFFFFFEVCEQLFKGIVYSLAVKKSKQRQDLAHQKERAALV